MDAFISTFEWELGYVTGVLLGTYLGYWMGRSYHFERFKEAYYEFAAAKSIRLWK